MLVAGTWQSFAAVATPVGEARPAWKVLRVLGNLVEAEGFDFVAMGRALLREPELISRWRAGDRSESLCVHCNKCMPSIYAGTHCVLVEPGSRPGHDHWPPPVQRAPSAAGAPSGTAGSMGATASTAT